MTAKQAVATDVFKNLPKKASQTNPGQTPAPKPVDPVEPVPVQLPDESEEDLKRRLPVDPDEEEKEEDEDEPPSTAVGRMNELDMLKQRAILMGIKFSNNVGVDVLRSKVQAKLDGEVEKQEVAIALNEAKELPEQLPVKSDRQLMWEQEMRLVRLRITNLDPKKKDLPGEIFTVANKVLGAVKKYIPYGEATDNGYHVPYIIYRQLREREFLHIKTRKDRQGRTIVETSMAREFALEELPQLTQRELNQLAASQAAAAGMSS